MNWHEITETQATPTQRKALYRFLAGVDASDVKALIRHLTASEASNVLAALVAAKERLLREMAEAPIPVDPKIEIECPMNDDLEICRIQ